MIQVPTELHQIRNPYLCVWMMGKSERILEVSNYARFAADPNVPSHHHTWLKEKFPDYEAKNTPTHRYDMDTPFKVTKEGMNTPEGYRDSKGNIVKEGKTAIHYADEFLPGSFPLWLKLDVEGGVLNNLVDEYEFDLTGLPYPMSIVEVNISRGHGWEKLDKDGMLVDQLRYFCEVAELNIGGWYEGKLRIRKRYDDSDKVLVRILYYRRLR